MSREVLARAWAAGLGPDPDADADLTIDVDSTIRETYGVTKQGARFGYTGVRGYHPLVASLADTGEILASRMRGGNAASARGAASFVRETISRIRGAGASGSLTVRADSAFYSRGFVGACRDHDVRFSVTTRVFESVRAAIEEIPESDWTPIPYWIDGGADVAETTYTAFKNDAKNSSWPSSTTTPTTSTKTSKNSAPSSTQVGLRGFIAENTNDEDFTHADPAHQSPKDETTPDETSQSREPSGDTG